MISFGFLHYPCHVLPLSLLADVQVQYAAIQEVTSKLSSFRLTARARKLERNITLNSEPLVKHGPDLIILISIEE